MAPSIFSPSLRLTRLVSTFKSPISISGRMMSTTVSNPSLPCVKLPPTLAPNSGRMMMSSTTVSDLDNPSPCLMLPPTLEGLGGGMAYNFYDLAQNKVINFNDNEIPGKSTRIVGSSHGWLALYNERSCNLILTNPVTRRHVKLQRPIRGVSKVIISCDAEQDECQAMMICNYSDMYFCRLGRSPTEWFPIGASYRPYNYNFRRCDLVYSSRHKLFFCLTKLANVNYLDGWDVASDPTRLRWENWDDGSVLCENYDYDPCLGRAGDQLLDANAIGLLECVTFRYLVFVEQADQLFLVIRKLVRQDVEVMGDDIYPYKTVEFDVYKTEKELEREGWGHRPKGQKYKLLDGGSLGGLAMFVGLNHSFAVSATEANGLKPNSIYFADDKQLPLPERWVGMKYGGHDIGIFDYENKTISPCYYPCDLQSFNRITPPPIWFTPGHY